MNKKVPPLDGQRFNIKKYFDHVKGFYSKWQYQKNPKLQEVLNHKPDYLSDIPDIFEVPDFFLIVNMSSINEIL